MENEPSTELMRQALTNSYDLYLVTKPNLPWVEDVLRYEEKQSQRELFLDNIIGLLEKNNRPYCLIDALENRIEQAQSIIDNLIQTKLNLQTFLIK
jgi:nicotinamide riboside kinase